MGARNRRGLLEKLVVGGLNRTLGDRESTGVTVL